MSEAEYTNRLISEKSPYLLQHAHNPVDWYPWGEEAFQQAKLLDRPIFLSIGYATCHWCHVMEREAFENVKVAEVMNTQFINIKLDREELPAIDSIYMEFAQSMMASTAGWPLNLLLTPQLRPFFAATYMPVHSSHGLMGLLELFAQIKEVWHSEERERIEAQADKIVEILSESVQIRGDTMPPKEVVEDAAELLFRIADPIYGGVKGAPKFPVGYQINFLLRYSSLSNDGRALFMAERTLDMMRRGGIYDHLGGGFARYSVDDKWLVPHFEKMMYDNALLASAYFEAWHATGNQLYGETCDAVLRYIISSMTHPQGGFYCAEDAESEGSEGLFYTWQLDEVQNILGDKESTLFCDFYNITAEGNFNGRSILYERQSIEEFASERGLDSSDLTALFKIQKELLAKRRNERVHPFKDDKILSSWNGLMIYSLAQASQKSNGEQYLRAAENCANFLKRNLWDGSQLYRRWREGEASFAATLEDYAYVIRGVIALFEMGSGSRWLQWAIQLNENLQNLYKSEEGAFYQTSKEFSPLIRKCQFADGAEPSGNAVHCENLLKFYQITGGENYLQAAEDIFKAVKPFIDHYPPGYCFHLMNLLRFYDRNAPTFIFALNKSCEHRTTLVDMLEENYIPHKTVVWIDEKDKLLLDLLPHLRDMVPQDGHTTLYLCREGACQKPMTALEEMQGAILAC